MTIVWMCKWKATVNVREKSYIYIYTHKRIEEIEYFGSRVTFPRNRPDNKSSERKIENLRRKPNGLNVYCDSQIRNANDITKIIGRARTSSIELTYTDS